MEEVGACYVWRVQSSYCGLRDIKVETLPLREVLMF